MTITLEPELARRLEAAARTRNTTPQTLAVEAIAEKVETVPPADHEEWSRRLRALARDCGVSLSDEATRRENIYD